MIYLHMLGRARIDVGKNTVVPSAPGRFALLLYLTTQRRRSVSRATLNHMIFPDQPETKANHSLRELVYRLRQTGVKFASDADGLRLVGNRMRSDHADVLEATAFPLDQLTEIEGGILPGYAPTLSETFTEWLDGFRARSARELMRVLVPELRRTRSTGNAPAMERVARACLGIDQWNEDANLAIAEGMALQGGKAKAVRFLDQYMEQLGEDSADLKLPAATLRRRIGERLPQRYEWQSVLPLTGRDGEMAMLMERLEDSRGGESRCVLLLGEAGIGKSRLAAELVGRAALAGVRFVTGTSHPHDTRRPMGAFVDLVPQLLELPGALGCSPESMSALMRLTKHDPLATEEPTRSIGQNHEVAAEIARAIGDLIDSISSETAVILWLEDAHWLDEMSLQMAANLVTGRDGRRVLVLFTSRERRDVLSQCGERTTTVTVNPLDPSSLHHLVQGALHEKESGSDESNQAWLVDTSAGNPFFLVCLLNHIQRTGERFAIPPTISELLDQRIAGLSPEATTVLETIVLLGKYATVQRLVSAIELPHFRLLVLLKELEERRMIAKNDSLIQPSHWLVADSVKRNSATIATAFSRRRIAELLEEEARVKHSSAMLWDCGEHWLALGDAVRAIQVIRECSRHAVDIGRPREAAELLQRAAQIANGDLRVQLAKDSIRIAQVVSERDVIARGVEILRIAGVPRLHDEIEIAELTANTFVNSDTEETIARLRHCLDDPDSTIEHRLQLSFPLIAFCAQHENERFAHEAFEILGPLLKPVDGSLPLRSLQFFLIYHAIFGDPQESTRIARQLLTRTDWTIEQQADAHRKAGLALWRCGHPHEAINALNEGSVLAEQSGLTRLRFILALTSASFFSDTGDKENSHEWLNRAERLADAVPTLRANLEYLILRTDIASANCDLPELLALYSAAKELGIPWSNQRVLRWANALKALIDHLSGVGLDPRAAIQALTQHHREGENGDAGDFEMAIALKISCASEQPEISRLRLNKYLQGRHRRQSPLSAMLRQSIAEIEAATVATAPI